MVQPRKKYEQAMNNDARALDWPTSPTHGAQCFNSEDPISIKNGRNYIQITKIDFFKCKFYIRIGLLIICFSKSKMNQNHFCVTYLFSKN